MIQWPFVMRGVVIVLVAVFGLSARAARLPRPLTDIRYGVVAFDLNGVVPAKLTELGVGVVGGSCAWGDLEPARGVYRWDCSDNVIAGAAKLGIVSAMTITCAPAWANGGRGCNVMPSDITDWYDFVLNYVTRYTLFDTVLGVWNEPNLTLQDDGSSYALLYINASNARNRVNPSFLIAGPEASHHALKSGYLARTMDIIQSFHAMNPRDPVAVHWYSDGPPLFDYLDAVRELGGNHRVWLSETGFGSRDEERQAQFVSTMLNAFEDSGRAWWTHMTFYRLWDGEDCCTDAILHGNYANKPAFNVYRDWLATHPPAQHAPAPDDPTLPPRSGR
jgi:Glycosyl hydrolase catalytic core